jgi:hypothetical protein
MLRSLCCSAPPYFWAWLPPSSCACQKPDSGMTSELSPNNRFERSRVSPGASPTRPNVASDRATSDPSKNVTVPEGMVWYAGPSPSTGIRLPPGSYPLEAEDADYWYFRSPASLEFRSFENGREKHSNPGGLMLGKRSLRMVPAGAYIEGDRISKIMVWKLGGDFLAMEGRQWRKSF